MNSEEIRHAIADPCVSDEDIWQALEQYKLPPLSIPFREEEIESYCKENEEISLLLYKNRPQLIEKIMLAVLERHKNGCLSEPEKQQLLLETERREDMGTVSADELMKYIEDTSISDEQLMEFLDQNQPPPDETGEQCYGVIRLLREKRPDILKRLQSLSPIDLYEIRPIE